MTVRDPELHDHFWINPFGRSMNQMTPDDLVLVNDKGVVVGGNMHVVNPAGYYIHSAIHRARPMSTPLCICTLSAEKPSPLLVRDLNCGIKTLPVSLAKIHKP